MITPEVFSSLAVAMVSELVGTPARIDRPFVAHALRNGVVTQLTFVPQTGEWILQLSQDSQPDPPFEAPDLLRVTSCPEETWSPLRSIVTQDAEAANRLLHGAAEVIRQFGSAYLQGEEQAFGTARRDRSERAAIYTASANQAPAVAKATAAWEAGDLTAVVEALSPHRGSLPAIQERRLALAERKLGDGQSDR